MNLHKQVKLQWMNPKHTSQMDAAAMLEYFA